MQREVKIVAAVLMIAITLFAKANATGLIAGATEPTQIMNNIQLVMSYVEQAQQTVTQMQQYQTMLKNLQQMTPSDVLDQAAQKLFVDQRMLDSFRKLESIVVNGQRISYGLANMDAAFQRAYPGYTPAGSFQSAYKNWSDTTLDSVKNALVLASVHAEDFATEQELISELQNKSQSAQGQLQALQAGNQIGLSMIGQLQRLRQLQTAQITAQSNFIANQQSESDAKKTALDKVFGNLPASRIKPTSP